MVEPVTTGALVAAALTAAAPIIGKDVVGQAAKDAYAALKSRLSAFMARDVERLEDSPTGARGAVIAEEVEAQPDPEKAELRALAETLRQALEADGHGQAVTGMVNQFNAYGGQQFNAPGGTQNFGAFPPKPDP